MTHLTMMFLHSDLIWEYRIRLVAMEIPLYRVYITKWDILQGRFRLCNWMSLRCLGLWINHLPAVCQSFLPVPDQKHLLTVEYHIHTWRSKDSSILSGLIMKDIPHSNSKDPGMAWWWWCRDPHYKNRKVSLTSYLYNRNPYLWEDGLHIETGSRFLSHKWNALYRSAIYMLDCS